MLLPRAQIKDISSGTGTVMSLYFIRCFDADSVVKVSVAVAVPVPVPVVVGVSVDVGVVVVVL